MGAIQRIVQYLDKKGVTKYRFYKETGLSNGFLDKGENIGSDKCEKIISCYTDLNVEWLITGRGDMLKPKNDYTTNIVAEQDPDYSKSHKPSLDINYERTIDALHQTIKAQEKTISALEMVVATKSTKEGLHDPSRSI